VCVCVCSWIRCCIYLLCKWRSTNAKAVRQCLFDVFAQVEVPSKITSDHGTCFTAEITTKFLEMFGHSTIWPTPLHSEGNSLVERLNQTFKKCKPQTKHLYKLVPLVLWSIRESTNRTFGTSRLMVTILGIPCGSSSKMVWGKSFTAGKTVTEDLAELQSNLKQIHDFFGSEFSPGATEIGHSLQ